MDLASFMERNVKKENKNFLNITDMAEWKKRNRVDKKTKVFIIKGGTYYMMRKALEDRGWV